MNRHERAHLRRYALDYARRYLGVRRLPPGIPAVARSYADGFTTYPRPSAFDPFPMDPFRGLAQILAPYRKRPMLP